LGRLFGDSNAHHFEAAPNFKVFHFFDPATGVATSAKTLDALTAAKIKDPASIYNSIKQNIDATLDFTSATLSEVTVNKRDIVARELKIAVPAGTTAAQWDQIFSAILYGQSKGVKVTVTAVIN